MNLKKSKLLQLKELVEQTNVVKKSLIPDSNISEQSLLTEKELVEQTAKKVGRPRGSLGRNYRVQDNKESIKMRKILWNRGIIYWKLDKLQKSLYDLYKERGEVDELIWVMARQIGKSYLVSVIAIDECLNRDRFRIAYVTPQKNQTRDIIEKNFVEILDDCPDSIRPKYNSVKSTWEFKNGSLIKVAGMNEGHIESLRGQSFDLIIIDEAGFPDPIEFKYAIESVLFPTLTRAREMTTLMITTPPKTYDHPFNDFWDKAERENRVVVKSIYDSPSLSPLQIQKIESKFGKDSISFKREFLCERIPEISALVIPEATKELLFDQQEPLVTFWKRPEFFQAYVSADFGQMDSNGFLFGYYDFRHNSLIIEDELLLRGSEYDTFKMAQEVIKKEKLLWNEERPIMRYCDNNLQIVIDFQNLSNLSFIVTKKDDKQAAINEVRMRVSNKTIRIQPNCKNLISHLQNAIWDKSRTKYRRGIDHHYDLLDALIYMTRNVNYQANPYPKDYYLTKDFISPHHDKNRELDSFQTTLKNIFTIKKKH